MIKQFKVSNYKALRSVTLDLSPVHVLIGPNDSGKTSILEAIGALCRSVDSDLAAAFPGPWQGAELVRNGDAATPITMAAAVEANGARFDYSLACRFWPSGRQVVAEEEYFKRAGAGASVLLQDPGPYQQSRVCRVGRGEQAGAPEINAIAQQIREALAGVHYYRWNPRLLALPAAPDSSRRFRMEPSGFGLARCLDDILGFDRKQFNDLESRFRTIFPAVRSIKLVPEPAYRDNSDVTQPVPVLQQLEGKGVYFEFEGGGNLVRASQISDGMLLILAYLTVLGLPKPPRLILVEEPENGIHPKRLEDVLRILRDSVNDQQYSQVLLTTHSPYLVDLFGPESVSLCRKEADGSVSVHSLSDNKKVRDQLDVFTLGEIWTAEGDEVLAASVKPTGDAGK